ncbi:MAG: hypothetical protein QM504_15965 [Pseudomonadota bacterium]
MKLCNKKYQQELAALLSKYTLKIEYVDQHKDIPGSWFGDQEAGLINNTLYIREDTPIHSALHESCHFICMDSQRRDALDTDAGGDYDEENGVCYLQILLAERLCFSSSEEQMKDMDDWGYTFRLGSCKAWFENDAQDARLWLIDHGLIDEKNSPLFTLRGN